MRDKYFKVLYEKIDDYLYTRFKKLLNYYIDAIFTEPELAGKSVFHAIAWKENYDLVKVYEEIKAIVLNTFKETNTLQFIYFTNNIKEEEEKYKKLNKIVEISNFIPYPDSDLYHQLVKNPKTVLLIVPPNHEKKDTKNSASETASQQLFEQIILTGIERKASDIHIMLKPDEYHVYYRIDGMFVHEPAFTMNKQTGSILLKYMLEKTALETKGSNFKPDVRLVHQDGRMTFTHSSLTEKISLRMAFTPDGASFEHMKTTIRVLYTKNVNLAPAIIKDNIKASNYIYMSEPPKSEQELEQKIEKEPLTYALVSMGYLEEDAKLLNSFLTAKRGLIVISGITNSGKSTLVNTILNFVDNRNVATVEDPVEYVVKKPNVVQYQLFQSAEGLKMDFLDYIKAFKRGDLDVVFIGEWRRHEGLTEAIIEQAMAGQLIYTTLHIATSFHIYEALKSMYKVHIEDLKSILYLSWNQTLVPKLCPHCKIEAPKDYHPSKDVELANFLDNTLLLTTRMKNRILGIDKNNEFIRLEKYYFRNPKGCPHCNFTGYKGRQPVYDYFLPTIEMYDVLGDRLQAIEIIRNKWANEKKKTKVDTYLACVEKGILSIRDIIGNEYVDRII